MTKLISSLRDSFKNLGILGQRAAESDKPTRVNVNPAFVLLGQTDLAWSAVRRDEIQSGLPTSSAPFIYRAQKSGVTVHTGTINRGGRDIAYFHLARTDGGTTVTYVPQELLLQFQEEDALRIPAIRALLEAA